MVRVLVTRQHSPNYPEDAHSRASSTVQDFDHALSIPISSTAGIIITGSRSTKQIPVPCYQFVQGLSQSKGAG